MADPLTLLANEADAAFERYLSTVRAGGTPEQRQWAFGQWRTADDKHTAHINAARNKRARQRTTELPAITAKR